jgi:hypothetical protein
MAQTESASALPLVSVIILNYNGLAFLPRCLETLRRTTYSPLELIVVDNCSTDGSVSYLREHHPDVKIHITSANLGYSGAYNAVIPVADGEVLVLLNFDVEVEPTWLDQAIQILVENPRTAAVQPKLRSLQRRSFFEYSGGSGGFIDRYGYPIVRGRIFDTIEEDAGQYDDSAVIHWACGAAFVVRRSAYEAAGGLDNDFFLHMEELDLCWRFWLMGDEVRVAPRGVVYHHAGAALSAERYAKMYFNHRNGLVMMLKNYSAGSLWRCLPVRWMLDWVTVLSSPFRREPKRSAAVLAAHIYVLFHWFAIVPKRRAVQRLRRRKDRELSNVILPFSVVRRYYFNKQRTYSQLISGT